MECIFHSLFVTPGLVTYISTSIDRARLSAQKLLNQGYVAPKLQSSFLKFYGRHHDLVNRYDKTVSKMKEDLFTWCPFLIQDFTWATWRVSCRKQRRLTLPEHTRFFGGILVVHLYLVFGVVCVLFLSCPCCSPEFVSYCWFPFALNIPLVFLYFSYFYQSLWGYIKS